MPSVTITPKEPQGLLNDGPILEVHFLIPIDLEEKFKAEGKTIPEPIIVNALIDTGASGCVIKKDIPEKLGLVPMGLTKICTPSQKDHECYQYFLRMVIPSHNLTYQGVFIAPSLDGQDISCLIGRDLLNGAIMIYIGYMNQFTLSLL
jgi:predicted aspartyl protease